MVIDSVGVIGGGTAGYLTAIALKRAIPELDVTVIESSTIPVIGVGEATTPIMPAFLHHQLGIDVHELHAAVRPTWKIGIRFLWGAPGDYAFSYPFGEGYVAESLAYEGHLDHSCFQALLMHTKRGPILGPRHAPVSLLPETRLAYHLENRTFVALLATHARRVGVKYEDAIVTGARRALARSHFDGEVGISALELEGGETRTFDLYVDCTGFRSTILEGILGSPFVSYESSLFCDAALPAAMPHDERSGPYTLAESMDNGWCWGIPVRDELHRGYVFASAFMSIDDAEAEMRRKNPTMGETRVVRFRSGRHREMWKANVVGMGNAYAFVEPLESTAIHMTILGVQRIVGAVKLDRAGKDPLVGDINRSMNGHWDYLRWFLGLHYKFNRKFDTPFWQACRADVDISGLQHVIDDFRANGPLTTRGVREEPLDPAFGPMGIDFILAGQEVPFATAQLNYDRAGWDAWLGPARVAAQQAFPQLDALDIVDEHPEWLDEFVSGERSWMPHVAAFVEGFETAGPFQLETGLPT